MLGQEKRIAPRHSLFQDGKVVTMKSVVDCHVKNISDSGACIKCHDQAGVPVNFRLLIAAGDTIRDARVVWRRGDFLGLQFVAAEMKAPTRRW